MARYTGPKNRIARRFGVNLFGRLRNPLLHKAHPPGMHGAKRKKKSEYGIQLEEKQKLRAVYGMLTHKKIVNLYRKALNMPGTTAHNFLRMLECRLDTIVYRLRMAPTIFAAQQLVSHGHILVDGKKVNRGSFQVQPGMTISVKEKSKKIPLIETSQANTHREIPSYLTLLENGAGKLEIAPEYDQISLPLPINVPLVCEFLGHTN